MFLSSSLVSKNTIFSKGSRHDTDEHVHQVENKNKGREKEDSPKDVSLRLFSKFKVIVVNAKFADHLKIHELQGLRNCVIRWSVGFRFNIELSLVFTNKIISS